MSNKTTAVIVLDSISPDGVRLTTFQLRYWRPIHSELMTHRVFSRNAGSSRARPSQKIIEQVRNEPWGPIHWGANQAGMQAHAELDGRPSNCSRPRKSGTSSALQYPFDCTARITQTASFGGQLKNRPSEVISVQRASLPTQ